VSEASPQPVPQAAASATAAAVGARPSLLRNRDFRVVLVGQGISALGDAVSFTALPLLVLLLTGSGLQMGIVGALQMLPDLLIGLPAGALADRWDRRKMMLLADLGRAVLTALIPISFALGLPTMTVILLVTFPISTLRVLFMAAYTGAVPNLVGRDDLGRANSYFEAIFSFGFILGPAVAGILAATIGPAQTLALDAISFLASGLSLTLLRRSLRAADTGPRDTHLLAEIWEGIRFVATHPVLRTVIAYWSAISIGTAALIPALTYYITVDRGYDSTVFGFTVSAYGIGSLLGALLSSRLGRERIGLRMVAGYLVTATIYIALALTDVVAVFLALAFVAGITNAVVLIAYITLRAGVTPDELMGRVGSTARTVSLGIQPVGMLAGGTLIELTNGGTTLIAMGIVGVAASLAFGMARTFREAGH
jgi:MFS family permease